MGCNCGGSKGKTIGQARKGGGSTMPIGYSADYPLSIGDADPDQEPIRVRVIRPAAGLRLGQAAWVIGVGSQQHLDAGDFVEITRTGQRSRQWRVGAFTYTDYNKAQRVAAAQGTTPVEIA